MDPQVLVELQQQLHQLAANPESRGVGDDEPRNVWSDGWNP